MSWRIAFLVVVSIGSAKLPALECNPIVEIESPVFDSQSSALLARGEAVRLPFAVNVRSPLGPCPFIIGFEAAQEPGLSVHAQRRPFGERLLDLPQAGLDRLLSGMSAADRPERFELDLFIEPQPDLLAGSMQIHVDVRAYAGSDPGDATLTRQLELRIPVVVPAHAELTVSSDQGQRALAGLSGLIDLGELRSGARGQAMISLTGNTAAWLTVERSAGALVHSERSEYRLPYALWIGSRAVPASQPASVQLMPGEITLLQVEVGEVERRVAGRYRDSVRLTIQVD